MAICFLWACGSHSPSENRGENNQNPTATTTPADTINNNPVATPRSLTLTEDMPTSFTLGGTDPRAPQVALAFRIVDHPMNGDINDGDVQEDGEFEYRPAQDFTGSDRFTFLVYDPNDPQRESTPAEVTVEVTPINDAPVLRDTIYTTQPGSPLVASVSWVDVDHDLVVFGVVEQGALGRLRFFNDGTGAFIYTPYDEQSGSDQMTVKAGDGIGHSNVAVLTINLDVGAQPQVGAPDPGFGSSGWTRLSPDPVWPSSGATSVMKADDTGGVLIAGEARVSSGARVALARLDSSGQLVTAFGDGGRLASPVCIDEGNHRVRLGRDNRIWLATPEWSYSANPNPINVMRLRASGELDETFGFGGQIELPLSSSLFNFYLEVDNLGRAYLAADESNQILRLDENGLIDPSFDNGSTGSGFQSGFKFGGLAGGEDVTNIFGLSLNADNRPTVAVRLSSVGTHVGLLDFDSDSHFSLLYSRPQWRMIYRLGDDRRHYIHGSPNRGADYELLRIDSDGRSASIVSTQTACGLATHGHFAVQSTGHSIHLSRISAMSPSDWCRVDASGVVDPDFSDNAASGFARLVGSRTFEIQSIDTIGNDFFLSGSITRELDPNRSDFAVMKFSADGMVDTAFATNGLFISPLGHTGHEILDFTVDSVGRHVMIARAEQQYDRVLILIRLNPDGSIDSSFNGGEALTIPEAGVPFYHENFVRTDSQDRMLVVFEGGVSRYTVSATLDTTFAGGGTKTISRDPGESEEPRGALVGSNDSLFLLYSNEVLHVGADGDPLHSAMPNNFLGWAYSDIAMCPDGSLIAVAATDDNEVPPALRLDRFDSTGSVDLSFGSGGQVIWEEEPLSKVGLGPARIRCDSQGRYVLTATHRDQAATIVLRFLSDGRLDANFGNNGLVMPQIIGVWPNLLAVDSNDRVVVSGVQEQVFRVTRLNVDGTVDIGFGDQGRTPLLLARGCSRQFGSIKGVFFSGDGLWALTVDQATDDLYFGGSLEGDMAIVKLRGR